jgi:hypothetical protein
MSAPFVFARLGLGARLGLAGCAVALIWLVLYSVMG